MLEIECIDLIEPGQRDSHALDQMVGSALERLLASQHLLEHVWCKECQGEQRSDVLVTDLVLASNLA